MKIISLPGLIDLHVHLRDPGQTHKEDFNSGTKAALAGGVTTIFDMPNNTLPIFSQKALKNKESAVCQKAVCDWGLYFGSDGKNIREFEKVKDHVVGLKLYLSQTTGRYIIEDNKFLEQIFAAWPKDKLIVIHGEEEKITSAIENARRFKNKLHITHVSTKTDLEKIISAKKEGLPVTCDITPHHLYLTNENGKKLGALALIKPPLVSKENQEFLWDHIKDIDCIASDHAPHTKKEKESDNPPFGVPGLETMLPLLITAMKNGMLSQSDIVRLTNTNPIKIFNITQENDTYVEVDVDDHYKIENGKLFTKCGWSPYAGQKVYGRIKKVFIRGEKAFEDGKILVSPGFGKSIL